MTAPAITVNLSAQVDSTSGAVAIGNMLVPVGGLYVVATTANRALGGRAHGIALSAWGSTIPGAVRIQHVGVVDAAVTGLGAGTASWVRVSTTGLCERCVPSGSDDIIGYCWTDGTLLMLCGQWTAAIVNGAALPINLAGGAGTVTGTLPVGNGGTGITSLGAGVATFLGTPSGANLAGALTTALPVSKGGTNRTALGGALQVLRTNTGATDTEWATISGSTPTGTGIPHVVGGVQNAATSLIVDADVDPAAAIAGTKVGPDFGAQNVATTGFVSASQFRGSAGGAIFFPNPAISVFTLVIDNQINANAPIIGYATTGSPYAVHGVGLQAMADANQTAGASVVCFRTIKTTGAITANRTLTVSAGGATDPGGREFTLRNTCTGAFGIVVSTGAGTTVTVANGKIAILGVDSGGVYRVTADT